MIQRMWELIALGVLLGTVAAILVATGESAWIVFLSLLTLTVVIGLIREALIEPEYDQPQARKSLDAEDSLPEGFGRALLEQIPVALMVLSERGRLVYGNAAAREFSPALKKNEHFANVLRVPTFVEAVNNVLADGVDRSVMFSVGLTTDNSYQAIINYIPVGEGFGHGAEVLIVITDRTQERLAEKMRSDFMANASHELRTPLASIIGYVETVMGNAADDPAAQEKFLKIVLKQSKRMQRLVDDLMSLNRIEASAHKRPVRSCDMAEIAREAFATLLPLENDYGVSLSDEIGDAVIDIKGDRDQLNQIFVNLIDNAMKYSEQGGTVRVFAAEPHARYPRMQGISISDQGAGISQEHLSRLTERFYRVNVMQSRNKGGTGLGLAIVKHIVNRHRGELQIESTVGKGSTFTVWLPIPAEE